MSLTSSTHAQDKPDSQAESDPLRDENLVAWCIVPFDAKKRSPAERAVMLKELGLRRCAYDWREEHVPTFEQEILEYRKHGVEFFAFWAVHDEAFRLFEKYDLHPQIWQILGDAAGENDEQKVKAAAEAMLPLVQRTAKMGCKLGLYNHGGWGGEPQNLVAVCQRLRDMGHDHVGIVYNFHHGHGHIGDWADAFAIMKPYLWCLNLNGMANPEAQPKILGIGKGNHEAEMIRIVEESDYSGPIGVLDHREQLDARESLQENLDGLRRLRTELRAQKQPRREQASTAPAGRQAGARPETPHEKAIHAHARWLAAPQTAAPPYSARIAKELVEDASRYGDAHRGAMVFAAARSACLSCHRLSDDAAGDLGGAVGPELTAIGKQLKPQLLVESLLWPNREVKPEYTSWRVLTADGKTLTGYRQSSNSQQVVLRDPARDTVVTIPRAEIEEEQAAGSMMPEGLLASMTRQQVLDLIRFLSDRQGEPLPQPLATALRHANSHAPASFVYDRGPLREEDFPSWRHPVNEHRLYDFYAKQAEHFRGEPYAPMLLAPFPGLDGGQAGHWGFQTEESWSDGRWNDTDLGTLQAGVFHGAGVVAPRGVCVRLGEHGELAACFNPETLNYEAVWSGGFVKFSPVRHGFMHGLQVDGELRPKPPQRPVNEPFVYRGFYRIGPRVVFAYRIGEVEYLDAPWCVDGKFVREAAPVEQHSLSRKLRQAPRQWPQEIRTRIIPGQGQPYAVDTVELPEDNPWQALMFCGGHDFLPDGSALVCTMQGDVWRVSGLDSPADRPGQATWRRFAAGLHHALGLVVADGQIYVQGRDQLTRLHDLNGDGEADYYECFSNAFETSPAGHDFICGLQRDSQGNFYTASGNQGLVRISPDGRQADVMATGFRNPDGLGLAPDGLITVPCSEGEWTPASTICGVRFSSPGGGPRSLGPGPPHFGYRGPQAGRPPELPLVYLPRGIDNSSGGQAYIDSDRWGPLSGKMVHFSFGTGSYFLLLRDEVEGTLQGAIVPMPGEFRSGAHRGRFRPQDGQLYVSGMDGWVSFTPDDGCFQRVRYTGGSVQAPVGFHVYENGVAVTFSEPLDREIAEDTASHYAQCWNYRYSSAYGSQEYSTTHRGVAGHDPVTIASAHVLADGRTLFLHLPDIQPVSQLHLRMHVDQQTSDLASGRDLFITVHKLDHPFRDFPGFRPTLKTIAAHPLLVDLSSSVQSPPNPWRESDCRRATCRTCDRQEFDLRGAGAALAPERRWLSRW